MHTLYTHTQSCTCMRVCDVRIAHVHTSSNVIFKCGLCSRYSRILHAGDSYSCSHIIPHCTHVCVLAVGLCGLGWSDGEYACAAAGVFSPRDSRRLASCVCVCVCVRISELRQNFECNIWRRRAYGWNHFYNIVHTHTRRHTHTHRRERGAHQTYTYFTECLCGVQVLNLM